MKLSCPLMIMQSKEQKVNQAINRLVYPVFRSLVGINRFNVCTAIGNNQNVMPLEVGEGNGTDSRCSGMSNSCCSGMELFKLSSSETSLLPHSWISQPPLC